MSNTSNFMLSAAAFAPEGNPQPSASIADFELLTIQDASEQVRVFVEWVVSIHILDDRRTSIQSSVRALGGIVGIELGHRLPYPLLHDLLPSASWPKLLPLVDLPSRHYEDLLEATHDRNLKAAREYLEPYAEQLSTTPAETWDAQRSSGFEPTEKSPWADAIGPLLTTRALMAALRMPQEQLDELVRLNLVLSIRDSDSQLLFPAAQLHRRGTIVCGLSWILGRLSEDLVDRYTLAAWLNSAKKELGGMTVWKAIREQDDVTPEIERLVERFRSAVSR